MRNVVLALLHLAVTTAKLCGTGGVPAVMAENLLLKQQLLVPRRARKRAPALTSSDRLLCGFWSIFLSPGRIRKAAIALQPSTLLAFHHALVLASTVNSFPRRAPRSADRRARAKHSSRPSSNSNRVIRGSVVHESLPSSPRRSKSTSTRTWCTACC